MIVRSTFIRMQFVDACVCNYPILVEELNADRRWNGKPHRNARFDTRASFLAWEMTLGVMEQRVFNERGASRYGVTERGALQDIAKAHNAYVRHPAFERLGVIGEQFLTFPAWEVEGEVYYSPRPVEGATFVMLVPTWHGKAKNPFTTWEPGSLHGEDRLAHDHTHRRLLELKRPGVLARDPHLR